MDLATAQAKLAAVQSAYDKAVTGLTVWYGDMRITRQNIDILRNRIDVLAASGAGIDRAGTGRNRRFERQDTEMDLKKIIDDLNNAPRFGRPEFGKTVVITDGWRRKSSRRCRNTKIRYKNKRVDHENRVQGAQPQ